MLRISRARLTHARLTNIIANNSADQFEIDLISGDYLCALKNEYNDLHTLAFTPSEEVLRWKKLLSEFRTGIEVILLQHQRILIHQLDEFSFFLIKTIVAASGYDARETIIYPGIMVKVPKVTEINPEPIAVEEPTPALISMAAPLQRASSVSTNTSSQSSDGEVEFSPRCSPTPNDEIEMTATQLQRLTSQLSNYEKERQEALARRELQQKKLLSVNRYIQELHATLLSERVLKPHYWVDDEEAIKIAAAQAPAMIIPPRMSARSHEESAFPAKLEAKEEIEKFHRPLELFTQNPCALAIVKKEEIYIQLKNKQRIRRALAATKILIEDLTKNINSLKAAAHLRKLQTLEQGKPKSPAADSNHFLFFQPGPTTQPADEKEFKRQRLEGPSHA
jgi:hypothetical protein